METLGRRRHGRGANNLGNPRKRKARSCAAVGDVSEAGEVICEQEDLKQLYVAYPLEVRSEIKPLIFDRGITSEQTTATSMKGHSNRCELELLYQVLVCMGWAP